MRVPARAASALFGACALLLPFANATPLALDAHVVSSDNEYLVPDVVVDVDGTLTFTNGGIRAHDVVAVEFGPSDNPWCHRYLVDECPLFASPLIGLAEQAPVEGIDQLVPLKSYAFYCSVHKWMEGTLHAV